MIYYLRLSSVFIWKTQMYLNVDTKCLNEYYLNEQHYQMIGVFKSYLLLFPFIWLNFFLQSFENEAFEVSVGSVMGFDGVAAGLPCCSMKEIDTMKYLFSTLVPGKEFVDPIATFSSITQVPDYSLV